MSSANMHEKHPKSAEIIPLKTILLLICSIALLSETAWATGSVNSFHSDSAKGYHQSETPEFLLRADLRSPEPAKSMLAITSEVTYSFDAKYPKAPATDCVRDQERLNRSDADGDGTADDPCNGNLEPDGTTDILSFNNWYWEAFDAPEIGLSIRDDLGAASTISDPNGDSFKFTSFRTSTFCGATISFDVVGYEDGSPTGDSQSYTLGVDATATYSPNFASVDEVRFENFTQSSGHQCVRFDDLVFDQAVSSNTQPAFDNLDATIAFDEAAGTPVVIDGDAEISDAELDGANDYAGSTLTVAREGGANADDDFGFNTDAGSFTVSGGDLLSGGNVFASFTDNDGTLTISFNSDETIATSDLVDDVLQSVTYAHAGNPDEVEYNMTLTFDDGGELATSESLSVSVDPELVPIAAETTLDFTDLGPVLSHGEQVDARIIEELLFYGFNFEDAAENSLVSSNALRLQQVTSDPATTDSRFETDETFSLVSIDIDNFSTSAQDVTVYGYLNGTLKSSQTFSFGAESDYQIKALGFTGIDEVRFTTSENNSVAIDNITVDEDTENTALKNSASLTFNGSDNYVDLAGLADDMAGESSMTVEFWVKPDIANQSDPDGVSLLGLNTASGDNLMLIFIGTSTTQDQKVHIYDGPGDSDFDLTGPELTDGKWHHIAYSFDDGTGTLYVNGREVGQNSVPLTFSSDDQWSIGQEYDDDTASDFFKGQIDEVRIWNTARTTQQIQGNLFQPTEGDETGLAGFWPFNNSVYDYGPNNNNAALINNPTFSSNTHPQGTLISGSEGWRIMSSPADGASYSTLLDTLWTQGFTGADVSHGTPNVLTWDEAAGNWTPLSDASTIPTAGTGFITYIYNDQDYDDSPEGFPKMITADNTQTEGAVTPSLTYNDVGSPEGNGWNLVGNPYGATINWDATSGWTKTNLEDPFYVWSDTANSGAGAYLSWNGSGGTLGDGLIAPWQGFWVQANAASPVLEFTDDVRDAGGVFLKENPAPQIELKLARCSSERCSENEQEAGQHTEMSSQAILMFNDQATPGKDRLDAWKLQSLNEDYLSLYTTSAERHALDINALPAEPESPLELNLDFRGSDLGGQYTLSWDPQDLPDSWAEGAVTLADQRTDQIIALTKAGEYSFEVPTTKEKATNQSPLGSSGSDEVRTGIDIPSHGPVPTVLKAKVSNPRFVLSVDPNGEAKNLAEIPESVELNQNYPNPFNPTTVIRYGVPEQAEVQLNVYDVLGRRVQTLINEQKTPGHYEANFDGSRLASGLYIYRLKIGTNVLTKKMMLIK